MTNITIYTTKTCPYCLQAKALLKRKNITDIHEIDVSDNHELRLEMMSKAQGRRTVPQIFINDYHVGGYDDLALLDKEGKLDKLLQD